MKKVLTVLLMGSLAMVFACGPKATNEGESDTTTLEAPATEQMEAPMPEEDTTETMSSDTTAQ